MTEPETVVFNLSRMLPYSFKGSTVETASIIMRAPRMPELNLSEPFGQIVTQAFMDLQGRVDKGKELETAEKKDNMNAGMMRVMLYASDRNIDDVFKKFKALANKVCTLDEDGTPLKDSLIDKMQLDDFVNMMCEYVVNFIYPSLSSALEDTEGDASESQTGAPSEAI